MADVVVLEMVLAAEREGTKHVQFTRSLLIPMVSFQSMHLYALALLVHHVAATHFGVGAAMLGVGIPSCFPLVQSMLVMGLHPILKI